MKTLKLYVNVYDVNRLASFPVKFLKSRLNIQDYFSNYVFNLLMTEVLLFLKCIINFYIGSYLFVIGGIFLAGLRIR